MKKLLLILSVLTSLLCIATMASAQGGIAVVSLDPDCSQWECKLIGDSETIEDLGQFNDNTEWHFRALKEGKVIIAFKALKEVADGVETSCVSYRCQVDSNLNIKLVPAFVRDFFTPDYIRNFFN